MFDGKPHVKASRSEIRTLKARYGMNRLGDQQALQAIWDQMVRDPSFHRKNSKKRTNSNSIPTLTDVVDSPRNQWAEQLTDQIENAPATEQHWPEKAEEKGVIEWDGN